MSHPACKLRPSFQHNVRSVVNHVGSKIRRSLYQYLPLCCNEVEMREATAKICKDFLHGAWKTISPKDLIFHRISGGLSNFLFYVALPEKNALLHKVDNNIMPEEENLSLNMVTDDADNKSEIKTIFERSLSRQTSFAMNEPKKVLIRIYGQCERGVDNIVLDSVIFTLLSERRLGPRLHGVFPGGRIEEFIPARALTTDELSDPAFSMKIAEKMAAIHSMDVPLCKEPQWLWKKIGKWLSASLMNLDNFDNQQNKSEANIVKQLKKYCLEKEVDWLKNYLLTIDSPVVFCHNDLQEGNILIREDLSPQSDNDDISVDYLAINHDSSSDSFLCENDYINGKDNNVSRERFLKNENNLSQSQENQNITHKRKNHKTSISIEEDCNTVDSICSNVSNGSSENDEPKLVLIDYEYCSYNHRGFDIANHFIEWAYDYTNKEYPYYFEKFDRYPALEQKEIFMKQYLLKINKEELPSIENINHLNVEVEAYSLASHLFWCLWAIVNAPKSQIPFGYWDYALSRINWYYRLKQEIIKKESGNPLKRKFREIDI